MSIRLFRIDELSNFVEIALENYAQNTVIHDLKKISASINLAKTYKKHNQENLASDLIETLEKGSFSKTIRIFTQDEINHILSAFKNDTYNNPNSAYKQSYYYGFVAIRFLTGMRPSETIALTWNDIIDKNGKLWILCAGKAQINQPGAIYRINPINHVVESVITLQNAQGSAWRLCINNSRDTLYYLAKDIYRISIHSQESPEQPFIPSAGKNYYGLDINPYNGFIYAADAIDYIQRGRIYIFQNDGTLHKTFLAGIIPNGFYFK